MCGSMCIGQRQPVGVNYLLLPYRSWGSNPVHQTWRQVPLSAEPPHLPQMLFSFHLLKRITSLTCTLVENQLTIQLWVYFWTQLCSIDLYDFLYVNTATPS